jgi:hypothetical protein
MLEKKTINLKIGENLRKRLQERAHDSGLQNPVPCISWGKWSDEKEERFMIGFNERTRLPIKDPIRFIECDGIEFLIIQDWICEKLDGKKLDFFDGKVAVVTDETAK